ncbi:L-seryl-tRNA(Ser) seleniumtransferase [Nakamurella sp. UYEF19]|uniref:L-seryl-tRNA(Sec) selenium transferase n=1 Tax=Nakamurella sp. UYEF19 TaxID=1756392 RepID=UPI00339B3E23
MSADPRRALPRTDVVLDDPRLRASTGRLGSDSVKAAVVAALAEARSGVLPIAEIADRAYDLLPHLATELQSVINATGVVLHTNLGRAPLSAAAIEALTAATGYVDVEFDLAGGVRAGRGRSALAALRTAVPAAEQVMVVNNGASALLLAVTTLAPGREVIVSRGEMVEIGDNFRLPDLMTSTGAVIREVGTTNRTSLADYAHAIGPETGCIVKIHPSNFLVTGFTSSVPLTDLATLPVPVIADIGSGLLAPEPLLPDEPDVASSLAAGAEVVTCSGDKLLGGPQTGLIFGDAALLERMRRHPLARALRCDKLTLAALEATLRGPRTPTFLALHADSRQLRVRCDLLADALTARVVPSAGTVGGGGAPGVELPGWAVALDSRLAAPLRVGATPVVGRVTGGQLLLDLRCVPPADDIRVRDAVLAARGSLPNGRVS